MLLAGMEAMARCLPAKRGRRVKRQFTGMQLAPTPVVKGKAAEAIYKEMRRKPSEASKKGAQILAAKFEKVAKV